MKQIITPLRYPGGKSKALPQIRKFINNFQEFREPFIGGGSVFIDTKKRFPNAKYWINDLNKDVYSFWYCLKNNSRQLVIKILGILGVYTDGRKLYNYLISITPESDIERAARFYILNRVTFSGLGDSGGYSEGSYKTKLKTDKILDLENYKALLEDVKITNLDYSSLLYEQGKDVFLFLDPPYYTADKLYGNNGDLHSRFDHYRLKSDLLACEHRFLMTYDDCNFIRNQYSKFNLLTFNIQYSMRNQNLGKEIFISKMLA